MNITAYVEIPAAESLGGPSLEWNSLFDGRYDAQVIDSYPASVDGRPVLVYAGHIYTAGEWASRIAEPFARLTVSRISDADAEAIRDAGWTIAEIFTAEERDLRPEDLVERRKRLDLTQAELARRLGVSGNTLACWERGDKPIGNPRMLDLALKTLERG